MKYCECKSSSCRCPKDIMSLRCDECGLPPMALKLLIDEREKDKLGGIDELRRIECFWVDKFTDSKGVKGYMLTVFHGGMTNMSSSKWGNTKLKNLKPMIDYLKSRKVKQEYN